MAAHACQTLAIPLMGERVIRMEFQGPPERELRTDEVPVIILQDDGQGGVCLSERLVKLDGFQGSALPLGQAVVGGA